MNKNIINRFKFKKCNCPKDYWEINIVDKDENYDDSSTVYYHCDLCGKDFSIIDFDTNDVIFELKLS